MGCSGMWKAEPVREEKLTSLYEFRVFQCGKDLVKIDVTYIVEGKLISRELIVVRLQEDGSLIRLKGILGGKFQGTGVIESWKRKGASIVKEDGEEIKATGRRLLK